ncbi:MAG: PIG-L family deacetylase [Xanthomonadales bacterium]|nr:PIG-L family deacetylase [Xanthomonadales bacterium]
MTALPIDAATRLLVIAPHPDDEIIACGGLLQAVAQAGGRARVLFATDGDNNPWPQRVSERRLRLDAGARKRWGTLRRAEAAAALDALRCDGLDGMHIGWPDGELTTLLAPPRSVEAIDTLTDVMADFAPTMVMVPAFGDYHPDHSALALLATLALRRFPGVRSGSFHIHVPPSGAGQEWSLVLDTQALERKRDGLRCYGSQLHFGKQRLLKFARAHESFDIGTGVPGTIAAGDRWRWRIALPGWMAKLGARHLHILALDGSGTLLDQRLPLSDPRLKAKRRNGALEIDMQPLLSGAHQVFAKVEHGVESFAYDITLWTATEPG